MSVQERHSRDDAFIARLSASAFGEYTRDPVAVTMNMARAHSTWVAWRSHVPLGFVVVRTMTRSAELCAIAVDEVARGTGVGSALLGYVERYLARSGTREMTLHTAQANLSALELFLKQGYRIQRSLPRFYRGVFDACALSKALPNVAR